MIRKQIKHDYIGFANIEESTQKLIEILPKKRMQKDDWLIVSISTQGVPIANTIAKEFNLSYDLLFCESICAPNNKNCIIGMVSETEEIVLNNDLVESFEINLDFIYGEAHRRYEEKILPKVYKYRKGDLICSLNKKNVLLIDEGCETGKTVMTSIKTAINAGAKSVAYATPVIPTDVFASLEPITDEIFSVCKVANFIEIEFYYETFKKLDTDNVLEIISNSKNYLPLQRRGENK